MLIDRQRAARVAYRPSDTRSSPSDEPLSLAAALGAVRVVLKGGVQEAKANAAARLAAAAPRMGRLLLLLEAQSYADARPCPFCVAGDGRLRNRLAHGPDCELDTTLREAGLRARAQVASPG